MIVLLRLFGGLAEIYCILISGVEVYIDIYHKNKIVDVEREKTQSPL